jgi:hypothetical protein
MCFGEEEKLRMTRGLFTTTVMLPEVLICRSLEICANFSSGLVTGKWKFLVFSIILLFNNSL